MVLDDNFVHGRCICVLMDPMLCLCLQFNFVGRILGPRGMTAKQLEQETGCKIMVRGKGSMRDKKKVRTRDERVPDLVYCAAFSTSTEIASHLSIAQEDANRGKPNWEHLSDELHVLITVEDTENRAQKKLERAVEEVQKLLIPVSVGGLRVFMECLWRCDSVFSHVAVDPNFNKRSASRTGVRLSHLTCCATRRLILYCLFVFPTQTRKINT